MRQVYPWQVWWADLDPVAGHEQAGRRPVLVVSSHRHLGVTLGALLTVLPLTTRERPGWLHRIGVDVGRRRSYVVTEQLRTISASRLQGQQPMATIDEAGAAAVRRVLLDMIA